jgi:hypothetical protein
LQELKRNGGELHLEMMKQLSDLETKISSNEKISRGYFGGFLHEFEEIVTSIYSSAIEKDMETILSSWRNAVTDFQKLKETCSEEQLQLLMKWEKKLNNYLVISINDLYAVKHSLHKVDQIHLFQNLEKHIEAINIVSLQRDIRDVIQELKVEKAAHHLCAIQALQKLETIVLDVNNAASITIEDVARLKTALETTKQDVIEGLEGRVQDIFTLLFDKVGLQKVEPVFAYILGIATGTPKYKVSSKEACKVAMDAKENASMRGVQERIYGNTRITTRYMAIPDYTPTQRDPNDAFFFKGDGTYNVKIQQRMNKFRELALPLVTEVCQKAIADAGIQVEDIGKLILVSSTGILSPSIDCDLIVALGLSRSVDRAVLSLDT